MYAKRGGWEAYIWGSVSVRVWWVECARESRRFRVRAGSAATAEQSEAWRVVIRGCRSPGAREAAAVYHTASEVRLRKS